MDAYDEAVSLGTIWTRSESETLTTDLVPRRRHRLVRVLHQAQGQEEEVPLVIVLL